MAQKLLSITLGTTSAKLAEIVKSGKKIQVYSAYDIPISEGLCDDGFILDADSLAAELKQYMSKYKIKTKKIAFSIASKRVASKEVVIPYVKEKQIKGLVTMNASEYFPVGNIEDYAINYSIIETIKNAENMQYRMNVIATPGELLEGYTLLAKALKCSVEIVDYAGNAILQVLKTQARTGEVSAILQLGYENTVINIMNGDVQIMQRSVATGLNAIIATVADSVGLDEEDAVAFLEDNDISRITAAYGDVKYVFDSLISSIRRIFDFYNGRSADHPIAGVMFIGDATYVNGIGDALSEGLGHEAQEIFRLNNVQVKNKSVTPEFATNFMANIGVVLNPMNLSYERVDEEKKAKAEGKLPIWLLVLSIILSIALVGASVALWYISDAKVKKLEIQAESLRSVRELETELNAIMAQSNAIAGFYESTKAPDDSIVQLISDLESIMPEGMSISNFNVENGTVNITAGGIGKRSVAKIIIELKSLNYVNNVHVDYVAEMNEGVSMYDAFTLSFDISAPTESTDEIENEKNDVTSGIEIEYEENEGGM